MEEEPWQSPKRRPHALCLEDLLEEQLEEHRNSRADVDSALLQSPLDPDLQQAMLLHLSVIELCLCLLADLYSGTKAVGSENR